MTVGAFTLSFEREATWELLREAATAMATALGLEPGHWKQDSRTALDDPNHSADAFRASWSRPGAVLVEECKGGTGNPRDGYGYDMTWRLELSLGARTAIAHLNDSSWAPHPKGVHFRLEGIEAHDLDTIRQALRALLGEKVDRTDAAYRARDNVRAALEADPERARAWLDAALAAGPPKHGGDLAWRELLAFDETLAGPSPERLRRRLVETPFDPGAWEQAAQGGEHQALAAATLPRIRPSDPSSLSVTSATPPGGWRRLEDGVGPRNSGWLRLVNDLTRALWPEANPTTDHGADRVFEGCRTASSAVFARWSGRPLKSPLRLRVTRTCQTYADGWQHLEPLERYQATPAHEVVHAWVWGPDPDDCAQFRQEARCIEKRKIHLGLLVGVAGSDTFRAAVEAALAEVTPFGWVAADPDAPFPDQGERPFEGLAAQGTRREAAAQLLNEVGAATPERLAALRDCSCTKPKRGYCEHAALLLTAHRTERTASYQEPNQRVRLRTCAREKALDCAFSVLTRKSGDWGIDHRAREARKQWAQAEACRG